MDFKNEREKIEKEKDIVNREINKYKMLIEEETFSFTSKYNDLKLKTDKLIAENRLLENEIEGRLNDINMRQTDYAQIIMCVKNLYNQLKFEKEEGPVIDEPTNTKTILDKLNFIKDKLRYFLEIRENWLIYMKEKNA